MLLCCRLLAFLGSRSLEPRFPEAREDKVRFRGRGFVPASPFVIDAGVWGGGCLATNSSISYNFSIFFLVFLAFNNGQFVVAMRQNSFHSRQYLPCINAARRNQWRAAKWGV